MDNSNHKKLLNLLRVRGEMTKLELSEALGLSHTTVSTYIEQLTAEGLVESAGFGESAGGRRPLMVRLAENARFFFGAYFAPDRVVIPAVNLAGREIARRTIAPAPVFEETLEKVRRAVLDIIKSEKLDPSRVMGLGMSFPGVVDSARKFVEYAPNIGLRSFSFAEFESALGVELFLENEAITAALAYRFNNPAMAGKNFVYVSVAEGIGTGIFIDGNIYKSVSNKAGEFGHIKVADNGLPCKCGRTDCWELYASKTALLRYCRELMGNSRESDEALLPGLHEAFKKGEAPALEAVRRYARYLFRGIETILLSFSPDEVIIGGDLGELMGDIVSYGVNDLQLSSRFYGYESVPIRVSALKETGAILGSALLPLYRVYDQET